MAAWPSVVAFAMAALSAIAWYAASPHCMWNVLRGWPRTARVASSVLALLSLLIWIDVLGSAAGLCAMLASLMLTLVVQPYLALFVGTPASDSTSAGAADMGDQRRASPNPRGSDFSRDAVDSSAQKTSRLKSLPRGRAN